MHGWIDLEMREAMAPTPKYPGSFHLTVLTSSRVSALKEMMATYIGRVENLKFYDKNPEETAEYLLR